MPQGHRRRHRPRRARIPVQVDVLPVQLPGLLGADAAYPGGIVDRVVAIGNGIYEVHYIGVNWPHHIFVNQDFQIIGAND
jgi:hypothetical protein